MPNRVPPIPTSTEFPEWREWLFRLYNGGSPKFDYIDGDLATLVPGGIAPGAQGTSVKITYDYLGDCIGGTFYPASSTVPDLIMGQPEITFDGISAQLYYTVPWVNVTAGTISFTSGDSYRMWLMPTNAQQAKAPYPPYHVEEFDFTWRRWLSRLHRTTGVIREYEYVVPSDVALSANTSQTYEIAFSDLGMKDGYYEQPFGVSWANQSGAFPDLVFSLFHIKYRSSPSDPYKIMFNIHNITGSTATLLQDSKLIIHTIFQ